MFTQTYKRFQFGAVAVAAVICRALRLECSLFLSISLWAPTGRRRPVATPGVPPSSKCLAPRKHTYKLRLLLCWRERALAQRLLFLFALYLCFRFSFGCCCCLRLRGGIWIGWPSVSHFMINTLVELFRLSGRISLCQN